MRHTLAALLLTILLRARGLEERDTSAICAIAKWEDKYLDEWLDYHLGLGVDKIYVSVGGAWVRACVGTWSCRGERAACVRACAGVRGRVGNLRVCCWDDRVHALSFAQRTRLFGQNS